jgi:phage gp46-like protein
MTDVLLRQTNDGGDITVEAGLALMSDGLETAAYLSLFGGNVDDAGVGERSRDEWWGNVDEPELDRRYRSETQNLIQSIPAVPRNLRRIEQAAGRDLAWMISSGVAKSVKAEASIPEVNRVRLSIEIVTLKETVQLVFG